MTARQRVLAGQGHAMVLVFVGGMAGAPARYVAEAHLPTPASGFPFPTFAVNVAGAFALGLLLESLLLSGPDTGMRRRARLAVGTGFLGAFTTYSSLALEIDVLGRTDRLGIAVAYAVSSLFVGLLAAGLGIAAARLARGWIRR